MFRQFISFMVLVSLGLSNSLMAAETSTAKPSTPPKAIEEYVTMETNLGTMMIKLYPEKSPLTVKNFLSYVDNGYYDGTIFHRIVPGFVVQGGGFDSDMQRKATSRPIRNESGNQVKNYRGTLSMARTSDPNSATTQFFINLRDNANLDWRPGNPGYAVFGELVSGLEVIDAMAQLERGKYRGLFADAPNEMVIIKRAYRTPVSQAPSSKSSAKQ